MPKGFARKLARCLRLVNLTTYGRYTSGELASKLAVTRRTIFRDLNCLRNAGYHVRLDQDQKYVLMAPLGRDMPRIQPEELSTILFCARTSVLAQSPYISSVVESVAERLVAGACSKDQPSIDVLHSFHIYGESRSLPPEVLQVLVHLVIARLQGARTFRIRYRGFSGELIETELVPTYFNVGKDGCFVGGTSSFHQGMHAFDVAHVVNIEPLGLSVSPPHVGALSDVPR